MAKKAIPEELDVLIQEYLTDGIITDKERQVLLRKAEKLGLDVEEVDLYIDAQQYKADQQVDAAVRKQRGQACPFCGGSVPQLTDKCPHCGQQITVEASEELKEIIDNLEDALVDLKSGKDYDRSKATIEKYARKAKLYYSNNPKIKPLLDEINAEIEIVNKKIAKQNRWKKKHPYLYAWFIIVIISIILALPTAGVSLLMIGIGGAVIIGMHESNENRKKEERDYYSHRR